MLGPFTMNLLTPQILGLVGGVLALLAVNAIAAGILSAAISLSLLPYDWFSRLIGPAQRCRSDSVGPNGSSGLRRSSLLVGGLLTLPCWSAGTRSLRSN
jgi:hypothetical protein